MKQSELSQFKQVLKNKQTELEALVWERDGISIERSPDALDEIQHAAQRELAIRNLDRESIQLRTVRDALSRIEDETFGICTRCEQEITGKRLAAVPWTPYCLHCQEVADRHSEQFHEYLFESQTQHAA